MRSVKLSIEGCFWDSQIYSGELLLLDADSTIHKIDWRQGIDGIANLHSNVQTAFRVSFSDSDLFYNPKVRKILMDPQLASPIKSQLSKLADLEITANRRTWGKFWRAENSPFDFLPTDTDIYYNQLFAAGNVGLFSVPRWSSTGKTSSNKVSKHHDGKTFQVRASDHHTAVAAATGDDGLFEFGFVRDDPEVLEKGKRLAQRPCKACDWAFQSVMGWADEGAFMASFRQKRDKRQTVVRTFDRVIDSEEIFGKVANNSYCWGSREKMYRISGGEIQIVDYNPPREEKRVADGKPRVFVKERLFSERSDRSTNFQATDVVSTGTAPFGTVIEFDDRLVVLRSDGETETYPGEPVHWRIFPRSEHYSNQLHILYSDHIEIISFVHDYFVDQKSKLYGFSRGVSDALSKQSEAELELD